MNEKWIKIARTGTFIDSLGRPRSFSAQDLDNIATAYDPDTCDAPLVFGHPKDNAPAFGWVKQLKREGDTLFASFAHVPGEVKDLVAKHHYRHVSMSLMPDCTTLRHVALLGAAQPAINGLGAVELSNGEDAICIEFADADPKQGAINMPTPEDLQQQLGALQQQIESLKAENAQLKEQAAKAEGGKSEAEKKADDVAAEFAAFKGGVTLRQREEKVARLIKEGKVKPAEKDDVLSFAATLAQVNVPVEFSAPGAEGKKESLSAEARYFKELEARPVDARFADFAAYAPPPDHARASSPLHPVFNTAKF